MQKNHFSLLKKFKNTSSSHLWVCDNCTVQDSSSRKRPLRKISPQVSRTPFFLCHGCMCTDSVPAKCTVTIYCWSTLWSVEQRTYKSYMHTIAGRYPNSGLTTAQSISSTCFVIIMPFVADVAWASFYRLVSLLTNVMHVDATYVIPQAVTTICLNVLCFVSQLFNRLERKGGGEICNWAMKFNQLDHKKVIHDWAFLANIVFNIIYVYIYIWTVFTATQWLLLSSRYVKEQRLIYFRTCEFSGQLDKCFTIKNSRCYNF